MCWYLLPHPSKLVKWDGTYYQRPAGLVKEAGIHYQRPAELVKGANLYDQRPAELVKGASIYYQNPAELDKWAGTFYHRPGLRKPDGPPKQTNLCESVCWQERWAATGGPAFLRAPLGSTGAWKPAAP